MFDPREKIALFIDGANLYAASKGLGFDIDYRRLLKVFQGKAYLLRAYYYTALIEDQEYSSIRPLIDWLDYNGYKVVTKPAKEFTDSMGRRKIKGNMDDSNFDTYTDEGKANYPDEDFPRDMFAEFSTEWVGP